MIDGLKPYSKYKDSGVPWLGSIPVHWESLPIYAFTKLRNQRERPDLPLLSVYRDYGVILRDSREDNYNVRAQDLSAYKVVEPGNLVLNKMKTWQGSLGISEHAGIVSPAYIVCKVRSDIHGRYLHQILRSRPYITCYNQLSFGVRVDQWDMRYEYFKRIPVFFPRPDEQDAIVRFLDHANRRIERYIRAKKKLIALLNEQKQAIIHRAVTRGLDPNVRLKPSGIPWLGDIPERWEVLALGRVNTTRCDGPFGSGLKSTHYTSEGVRVVRLQNIGQAEFQDRDAAFISQKHYATLGDHSVMAGDLLVAGLGDDRIPAGRACVAPLGIEPAMVKADCFRFRMLQHRIIPDYAAFHLSATASAATSCLSTGATRQRINLKTTARRAIALPPIPEQEQIIAHVVGDTACLAAAIARTEREIALIREYRTRLVADVVTGQIDVCAAAAKLPDEAAELEPLDGVETLPEEGAPVDEVDNTGLEEEVIDV